MHREHFALAESTSAPEPTGGALTSAPRASSSSMLSTSPAIAASRSGGERVFGLGSAPRSSKSFTTGPPPGRAAAAISAVRKSFDTTFTSAPWASSNRVFARSVAAHMRAVALSSLRMFGSAPFFNNCSNAGASEYSTAYMNGVEPSGPRALSNLGSSVTNREKDCRSPVRNASTIATALEFTGGTSASLANASGHSAP